MRTPVNRTPPLFYRTVAVILFAVVSVASAQSIPSDPEMTCTVPATTVNGWFKSGAASLNGVINPANSVAFPNTPNCSFYAWSYQMFLWLTSPTPAIYGGGGGRIFESSAFFDVSPPDSSGQRTMTAHSSGVLNKLALINRQFGPNRLHMVVEQLGGLFEVAAPARRPALPRVETGSGERIEFVRAR